MADVVVANNSGPARVYINAAGTGQNWVGLRLWSDKLRRDVIGSVAIVKTSDGRTLTRRAHTDGSYASASDPRIAIGLGRSRIASVSVKWADGATEDFPDVILNRYSVLKAGTGKSSK